MYMARHPRAAWEITLEGGRGRRHVAFARTVDRNFASAGGLTVWLWATAVTDSPDTAQDPFCFMGPRAAAPQAPKRAVHPYLPRSRAQGRLGAGEGYACPAVRASGQSIVKHDGPGVNRWPDFERVRHALPGRCSQVRLERLAS